MDSHVREAIESARSVQREGPRLHSFATVRLLLLSVAQNLPGDMTMTELCDQINNANSQGEE